MNVDWSNPQSKISKYFTVHDATFLPSWGIYHTPNDSEKSNILKWAETMDKVRDFFQLPIIVHCWIRPEVVNCPGSDRHGKDYNHQVGGAKSSAHIKGIATDFHVSTMNSSEDCLKAREKLVNAKKLEELNIRMEKRDGPWLHLDSSPVKSTRYFTP